MTPAARQDMEDRVCAVCWFLTCVGLAIGAWAGVLALTKWVWGAL